MALKNEKPKRWSLNRPLMKLLKNMWGCISPTHSEKEMEEVHEYGWI